MVSADCCVVSLLVVVSVRLLSELSLQAPMITTRRKQNGRKVLRDIIFQECVGLK